MPVNERIVRPAVLLAALAVTACTDEPVSPTTTPPVPAMSPALAAPSAGTAEEILALMDAINAQLAVAGTDYRVAVAEYLTSPGGGEAGSIILARDLGNKRLDEDFVPFDPRRSDWSGSVSGPLDDITFAIDQTTDGTPILGGLSGEQATAAIQRGVASWEAVQCSNPPLTENPSFGLDIGIVAFLEGLGGATPFVFADVQHAGFSDIDFGGFVLGVTFTFVFVTDAGDLTDIDGNGRADVAFREIYYDPTFPYRDDGVSDIDLESVAVHEFGHGLSQAHFGTFFLRNDGTVDASPRAVMNGGYLAPFRDLAGPDSGGHCGTWASWPGN